MGDRITTQRGEDPIIRPTPRLPTLYLAACSKDSKLINKDNDIIQKRSRVTVIIIIIIIIAIM